MNKLISKYCKLFVISAFIIFNLNIQAVNADYTAPNKQAYVNVNSGKIFYQVFGKGTPIIITHGGPGLDQTYLQPQILELAKDYQLIFYDQRGSGHSIETPLDEKHINIDQFVADLEALRAELKLDKFILLGHSWGGWIAMNYAVKHPQQLSALLLVASSPADHAGQKAFLDSFSLKAEPILEDIKPLFYAEEFNKLDAKQISEVYRKLFSTFFYNPEMVNNLNLNFNADAAKKGFKVNELMSQSTWLHPSANVIPQLKELTVPTLIIHGKQDVAPVWTAEAIKASIADSNFILLNKCGHFPYIEQPELFFAHLKLFMQNLP